MIEKIGLGKICRRKALEMVSGPDAASCAIASGIGELRFRLRTLLQTRCGVAVKQTPWWPPKCRSIFCLMYVNVVKPGKWWMLHEP